MKPISNRTRKWIRAGIEVLVHGGTAALISGVTLALSDPKDYAMFTTPWWKMVGTMFAGNGGVRFLQWWANNPLPPESDSQPPFPVQQPMISMNPLSKVMPTATFDPAQPPTPPTPK